MMRDRNTAADGISIDDGKVEIEAQASTTESIQNCTTAHHRGQGRVDRLLCFRAEKAMSLRGKKEGTNEAKTVLLAQAA